MSPPILKPSVAGAWSSCFRRVWLAKALVLDTAMETVELFHQHWNEDKNNLPLYPDVVSKIENHLATVTLASVS